MDIKAALGVITVILSIIGHVPYLLDILKGKTKPHAYTWFVWTLLTGIACIAQFVGGAGPGAWTTAVTTLLSLSIFLLSLKHGSKDITVSDKWCLAGALAAIVVWVFTDSPVLSIILVTVIDALAFMPTVRKTFKAPEQETLFTYALNVLRHGLTVGAIQTYSIVTVLYPVALLLMNGCMTLLIVLGRKKKRV